MGYKFIAYKIYDGLLRGYVSPQNVQQTTISSSIFIVHANLDDT